MNRSAAKAMKITRRALWEYFGLGKNGNSQYLQGLPFSAEALSLSAPKNLHETQIHAGGTYVHLEGGKPAQKKSVIAMLDGIPHSLMREAYHYLRDWHREEWDWMERMMRRLRGETVEQYADRMEVTRKTAYNHLYRALDYISAYLERELDRAVGAENVAQ